MSKKITPDEWICDNAHVHAGYSVVISQRGWKSLKEAQANAALIAAAPEMYDFIEHLTTETGHSLLSQAGYLGENLYKEAKELCRKARGESEVQG